jgi:hypothetical protein
MIASTYPVWGWGGPGGEPDRAALEALAPVAQALLGFDVQAPERPALLRPLPAPRLAAPAPSPRSSPRSAWIGPATA